MSESSGSSTWDVNTSESHIFQGAQDWKHGCLRAMLGRHILIEGVQHRRYDQVHLYVNPKIGKTVVKHDCLSKVADWTFTPGKKYDIKWTIFNRTFVLPGIDFVCDPALDADGVFGYDFVEEFSHFFFKAWPSGLVQPSRFCIANPLFHPVNVDKVLRVYTAAQVRGSVIGVGVFFGPEAGLNMWIPQFGTESKVSKRCAWETTELAEFNALCTTLSTVLKVARSGQYIRVEFHTSSKRLVSLMQTAGISSEGAELIVYHFDNAMRFLDLRKEFAVQNKIAEGDCIRILPYTNEVSAKQAQRLAGLAAMCSPEPEDSLKDNQNFYFRFLANRKSARVCKQLVKGTFRTILEDYLKLSGQHDYLSRGLSLVGKGGNNLTKSVKEGKNGVMIGILSEGLQNSNGLPSAENAAKSMNGPETEKPGILYNPPHLRWEGKETGETPSAPSQQGWETTAQGGDVNLLMANARMEAQRIREDAIREAENMLEDAYMNASIIRKFAPSGAKYTEEQVQKEILMNAVAKEREEIISGAQHEARITIEQAKERALHQAEIIMDEVIQKEKSILAEAEQIITDARKEERRIIDEARFKGEREALVRISYAQGQADLKIRAADHTMKQAEEVGGRVQAEMLALEENKRLEERQVALTRMAEVKIAAEQAVGSITAEARTAIENTRSARKVIEKINSDARIQAKEIIENAKRIRKKIHEKEKETERIRADAEAEVEKIKKDAGVEIRRRTAELMEKARADADAERERIKKDIEVAMSIEMEKEEEEIRKDIEQRAKHDAEQIISQAMKKVEEFDKKMEALKQKTEEDCRTEIKRVEEYTSFQRKREKDAAGHVLEKARARAGEIVRVAQGNLDMVPVLGDILGSALPMTAELFVKEFLESSDDGTSDLPLSAEGFARKLENSRKNITLGQLVTHNVEGARLFLEECHRKEKLAHEIELYVDERDRRLKYKKGKRLLPLADLKE